LENRPVQFADIAAAAGCAVSDTGTFEASMGIACADFDGDSWADLYLTHYYRQKNTLYHNLGNLTFTDDSRRTRVAATSFGNLGFGVIALDYDQDGAPDLFLANGHVLGPSQSPNEMRPQLLRNDGRGNFDDVSDWSGDYFQELLLGRGAAAADFDDDGDLDLAVTHLDAKVALLRNDTSTPNHFLGIELGPTARNGAVGGRVAVTAGGRTWTRPITSAGSYLSSSDTRLLFGLGDARGPATVEVHWPSGQVDRWEDVEVDRYWLAGEGKRLELRLGAQ
jgi:hypothetical protein